MTLQGMLVSWGKNSQMVAIIEYDILAGGAAVSLQTMVPSEDKQQPPIDAIADPDRTAARSSASTRASNHTS